MDLTSYGASPYAPGGKAHNTQVSGHLAAALRGFLGKEEPGSVLEPGALERRSLNHLGEGASVLNDLANLTPAKFLPAMAGIFIGPKARTWNYKAAEQAAKLLRTGTDPEEVRRLTNTFMGADGLPRQEISDDLLRLRTSFDSTGPTKANNYKGAPSMAIGGVVDHPELFAAYPEILNKGRLSLRKQPEWLPDSAETGQFKGNSVTVRAKTEAEAKSLLVHELQHYVQRLEDFARGGSPEELLPNAERVAAAKNKGSDWAAEMAYQNYLRMAGEVEARLAQQRRGMDMRERLASEPVPDTPRAKQRVMWYD